jgi:hypothetical protein
LPVGLGFQDLSALALQGGSKRRFDRGGEDFARFAKKRRRGHRKKWVRFANSGQLLAASPLAIFEVEYRVRHRPRRWTPATSNVGVVFYAL